ncbi:MAG: VRR-NUC domain-containing protein [Hyphomonadaceae bacterium]|nr:VRR-NUC domain-containing protein [Hyphomonadaceae bacterium]
MKPADHCPHTDLDCLNQFEFVRKYRCRGCNAVMMCACDEARGRRFLPHQLNEGTELETQARVPVTAGFQPKTCPECRGLPPVNAPTAAIYGRTGKVERYYWRELYFMTEERVAAWMSEHPGADEDVERKRLEKEVLVELQQIHQTHPKYEFTDLSQDEVIKRFEVELVRIDAPYLAQAQKGRVVDDGRGGCSVEAFVQARYEEQGWKSTVLESAPFHVLFGVFMWLLVQDSTDEKVRIVGFGERSAFEERREGKEIWTLLPEDFGGKSYALRRAAEAAEHFELLVPDRDNLLWLFDYWLSYSADFRNYLWAHRDDDIERARRLIEILPPDTIVAVLRYLLDDYWGNFCGWPDLLCFRDDGSFFLVEVKSSGDKLSEDQKRWIRDNHDHMQLPFKLVKVHRQATQARRAREG